MMTDENIDETKRQDRNGIDAVCCDETGERSQLNRRRVLSGIVTAVGFGFAGAGVHSGSAVATAQALETDDESSRSADSKTTGCIVIREASCGNLTNSATIICHSESSQVIVSGTISGEDACQTVVIETATYTSATETLDVVIATETKNPTGQVCSACIYEIDYEAFITLQEHTPTTVVVHHRSVGGDTVVAREPCSG